jgi:hypothetical protein
MLLDLQQPGAALIEFRKAAKEPNRFRAVPARRKQPTSGDRATARQFYEQLLTISVRGDVPGRRTRRSPQSRREVATVTFHRSRLTKILQAAGNCARPAETFRSRFRRDPPVRSIPTVWLSAAANALLFVPDRRAGQARPVGGWHARPPRPVPADGPRSKPIERPSCATDLSRSVADAIAATAIVCPVAAHSRCIRSQRIRHRGHRDVRRGVHALCVLVCRADERDQARLIATSIGRTVSFRARRADHAAASLVRLTPQPDADTCFRSRVGSAPRVSDAARSGETFDARRTSS